MRLIWISKWYENFRFADPVLYKDLFELVEMFMKSTDKNVNTNFNFLLKLFDKAEIVNHEVNSQY